MSQAAPTPVGPLRTMKLTSGVSEGWETSAEVLAEALPEAEAEPEEAEPVFLGPQPARAETTMAAARSRDSFFFIIQSSFHMIL